MWSLTSQREKCTSGPESFQSSAKKDLFNTIPSIADIGVLAGHVPKCQIRTSVRGRTRLIQGDHNLGDVGGHFEAALGTLQRDGDALGVPELHAANAADHGDAGAH